MAHDHQVAHTGSTAAVAVSYYPKCQMSHHNKMQRKKKGVYSAATTRTDIRQPGVSAGPPRHASFRSWLLVTIINTFTPFHRSADTAVLLLSQVLHVDYYCISYSLRAGFYSEEADKAVHLWRREPKSKGPKHKNPAAPRAPPRLVQAMSAGW